MIHNKISYVVFLLCFVACTSNLSKESKEFEKLLVQKKYRDVKSQILRKIETNSESKYYKYLGHAYSGLKDYQNCINSFKIYLEDSKFDVNGYIALGDCYFKSGNHELAYKTFQKAYFLDSTAQNVCYNLGIIEFNQNNYNSALRLFTKELQNNSSDFNTLSARADCYETIGQYSKAIIDAKKAIKINSKNYDLIHTLGVSQLNNGDLLEATETFKNGLIHFPNSDDFHLKLASCYGALGIYEKAITESSKAIRINSRNTKAHYLKALGFMKLENLDSSCYYFQIANKLDPKLEIPISLNFN